ncbi:MAG TPA: glycoside hydrolase family 172 protein [Terriglobia bacterium]|nr:glycoside hydrolase family 172 protein [Terriglobia bacterium]
MRIFRWLAVLAAACALTGQLGTAQTSSYDGLGLSLGNLPRLSHAQTRSISPENPTGEKGKGGMATTGTGAEAARDLGQGWKISPSFSVGPKKTLTLAQIQGPGAIQHIWMTPTGNFRFSILRFYWDGESDPSVEVPVGDFFACGWGRYAQVSSLAVCVNPGSGLNSYWQMPFRKSCKMTLENIDDKPMTIYYQIDYTLTEVPADAAYFHAQFRRSNPLPLKTDHVILDGVKGWGQYVGTYLAWGVHNTGWWGEGEIKFFLDGDSKFPTINGTGTEDYFCGSYDFDSGPPVTFPYNLLPGTPPPLTGYHYTEFTTPYTGLAQVIRPDGHYDSQERFGLYRWHIMDPIRFEQDIKVTIQALGWREGWRYLPLQDDISSVAYWYQTEPHAPFPKLPDKDYLEVN